jgi:hypothetical protein
MPLWSDFFRLFTQATEEDPLAKFKDSNQFPTIGVAAPQALGNAGDGSGYVNLRQTSEMIDTTTLTNRIMRYKEYERLRNIPEIEASMQMFADEACVAGSTKIATPHGFFTIQELAEKRAEERFLVYSFDIAKGEYVLAWAYAPRLVKEEETITIVLDNGNTFTTTRDHRVLKRNSTWSQAQDLRVGDELMPFYRKPVNTRLTKLKSQQYHRVFTFHTGWISERQFIDDWRGQEPDDKLKVVNRVMQMIGAGVPVREIRKHMTKCWETLEGWMHQEGFSHKETKWLYKNKDRRKILGIVPGPKQKVYDISVSDTLCFATEDVILHNCQQDDSGNILKVQVKNQEVKEELEFVLFNRKMLNLNKNARVWFKNLCIYGDWFVELVYNPENPTEGIYRGVPLPPETIHRIETVKGKLLEFQQAKDGPDYNIVAKSFQKESNDDLSQSGAVRFTPAQIIHFRIGDDRKTFFPYGQSLIEPARGPAHTLRLMEDAMLVYRLTRAPERRIYYIDVGQLSPQRAEAFIDRLKNQLRKRRTSSNSGIGANAVEERWQPPTPDEDIWVPIRQNTNTRIDTLPGAENLGEIDDAIYFRAKLLIALNVPKGYFNNEDPNVTRMSLSAIDMKFARMIERLQSHFEDGILEICERHLKFRGFPEETFKDLKIKMTPPSEYREASRAEIITSRIGNAGSLKSGQLLSDYDIYIEIFKYSEDVAMEKLARKKIQQLEDLKLQVLAQNPALLGVGIPGQENSQQELGSEPGGPNFTPQPEEQPGQQQPEPETPDQGNQENQNQGNPGEKPPPEEFNLPEPEKDDLKKYDLEIQNYENDMDAPNIDYSVQD